MEVVSLYGQIAALHEPRENDGFPELESIPHAFAVEFLKEASESRGKTWCIFCDSEKERVRLMALLALSSGLEI